jgi:hypothetical protein
MPKATRTCTICGKTKAESEFKVRKGKVLNQCKACINAQARKDSKTAAAMERTRGRVRKWAATNPEDVKNKTVRDTEARRKKREGK